MSNLRLAMDAAFWDLNVSSPQTLDGSARSVPGEPYPIFTAPACRTLRPQQLSLLGNGFPLRLIPSISPTTPKDLGSFSLQSLLLKYASMNWWVGLVGQFRPKKLITSIKEEVAGGDEFELPAFKDVARHFLDKSLYALGFCSQISLTPASSLYFTTEVHGEKKGRRSKAMYFHKLPQHDVTLEAAWPELFIDENGAYWDVPASISLDLTSIVSESGLRYRFGIHKNSGDPQPLSESCGDVPLALMPGVCAKAAFSYEKSRDIWRQKEKKKDLLVKTDKGRAWWFNYDTRLREPHAAISGIIGGTCSAWFGGGKNSNADSRAHSGDGEVANRRQLLGADLFGSVRYTFQHGKFRKPFGDLTRVDARLDICSASAFIKGAAHLVSDVFGSPTKREVNLLASPQLNVIFQQQVAGPIVFRVDSRFSPSGRYILRVEDVVYSMSYSLRALVSGKVLAWYSPKRKEGMIELRVFEF
ncbi:protein TRIGALACTOSYLDIACYLGLYCEROL 4, chloroplastic [Magnolia sinica]|uniref:protein TRIGALACTOSYLDIACYLGLYCEROL 4, chloroplastic n=1 Tax=Magnolia sinica TaxID=86752 RepID=UPI002658D4D2|nr:protein TRIGALACTOSYLDIACYLGLYCEROL 4, chloroplastic [Magnolia sinica]